MSEDLSELTDRCVCFIDILGYSNRVIGKDDETLNQFGNLIKHSIQETYDFIDTKKLLSDVTIVGFTDCFVIIGNHPLSSDTIYRSVMPVIDAAGYFQRTLLLKYKVMVRGAISFGKMWKNDSVLFGPLFVSLNKLEKENSLYPRIIIDKKLMNYMNEHRKPNDVLGFSLNVGLLNDDDDFYFVSYIAGMIRGETYEERSFELIKKHHDVILDLLNDHFNIEPDKNNDKEFEKWEKILDKLRWVVEYHNRYCRSNEYRIIEDRFKLYFLQNKLTVTFTFYYP